jgi:hypothetical protein
LAPAGSQTGGIAPRFGRNQGDPWGKQDEILASFELTEPAETMFFLHRRSPP